MKKSLIFLSLIFILSNCSVVNDSTAKEKKQNSTRNDNAYKLDIDLSGSLQNPAWSPDGSKLLITRFKKGYNEGTADLYIIDLSNLNKTQLVSDGSSNVNLTGSVWNPVISKIVFSSSRDEHDEIYSIDDNGSNGDETKLTMKTTFQSYEPRRLLGKSIFLNIYKFCMI